MGRNQQRFTGGLTPASGLSADEEKELAKLEKWIFEQEYRVGNIGQTVYHQRRDALLDKKAGGARHQEVKKTQEEDNDDPST